MGATGRGWRGPGLGRPSGGQPLGRGGVSAARAVRRAYLAGAPPVLAAPGGGRGGRPGGGDAGLGGGGHPWPCRGGEGGGGIRGYLFRGAACGLEGCLESHWGGWDLARPEKPAGRCFRVEGLPLGSRHPRGQVRGTAPPPRPGRRLDSWYRGGRITVAQASMVSDPPVAAPRCPATSGQVGPPTSRRRELFSPGLVPAPRPARGTETLRAAPHSDWRCLRGKAWRSPGGAVQI